MTAIACSESFLWGVIVAYGLVATFVGGYLVGNRERLEVAA